MRVAHQLARTRTPLIVALGTALAVAGLAPAAPFAEALAQSKGTSARACGELVTLKTHDGTTTRYALAGSREAPAGDRIALVLLVGGFVEQEAEVVAGIARFVRGGSYEAAQRRHLVLTIRARGD